MKNCIERRAWRVVGVLAITLLGALTWAPAVSAWTIGKPIVTYWDGPGVFDDRVANQAVNGGFNLVWVHSLAAIAALRRSMRK